MLCVCDGANLFFDIDDIMRQKLVDVGQGVRIPEPLDVDSRILGKFWGIHISTSYLLVKYWHDVVSHNF